LREGGYEPIWRPSASPPASDFEQTELDSLATLRPDDLSDIARGQSGPFLIETWMTEILMTQEQWTQEANGRIRKHSSYEVSTERLIAARADVEESINRLKSVSANWVEALIDEVELPEIDLPRAYPPDLVSPPPLIDSSKDYVTATLGLLHHKKEVGL